MAHFAIFKSSFCLLALGDILGKDSKLNYYPTGIKDWIEGGIKMHTLALILEMNRLARTNNFLTFCITAFRYIFWHQVMKPETDDFIYALAEVLSCCLIQSKDSPAGRFY